MGMGSRYGTKMLWDNARITSDGASDGTRLMLVRLWGVVCWD